MHFIELISSGNAAITRPDHCRRLLPQQHTSLAHSEFICINKIFLYFVLPPPSSPSTQSIYRCVSVCVCALFIVVHKIRIIINFICRMLCGHYPSAVATQRYTVAFYSFRRRRHELNKRKRCKETEYNSHRKKT